VLDDPECNDRTKAVLGEWSTMVTGYRSAQDGRSQVLTLALLRDRIEKAHEEVRKAKMKERR
jgi:hypothetical protein